MLRKDDTPSSDNTQGISTSGFQNEVSIGHPFDVSPNYLRHRP